MVMIHLFVRFRRCCESIVEILWRFTICWNSVSWQHSDEINGMGHAIMYAITLVLVQQGDEPCSDDQIMF